MHISLESPGEIVGQDLLHTGLLLYVLIPG